MIAAVRPITSPLAGAAVRAWDRLCLACLRWAAREICPLHPDRHWIEGQVAKLERKLRS